MTKHTALTRWLCAAAFAAALIGCSDRERTLLDTVPSDSKIILQADLSSILKSAGCESENGSITLTPDIVKIGACIDEDGVDVLRAAASWGNIIDLSQSCVFTANQYHGMILTAPLRSETKWEGNENMVKSDAFGQMQAVDFDNNVSMLVGKNQAWISHCQTSDLLNLIDSIVKVADKHPLSKDSRMAEFLSGDQPVKGRVIVPVKKNPLGDKFNEVYVEFDYTDRMIMFGVSAENDGEPVNPFAYLTAIKDGAIAATPKNIIFGAAFGLGPKSLKLVSDLARPLPLTLRYGIESVASTLDKNGGTFAVVAAPGGGSETIKNLSLDSWLLKAVFPIGGDGKVISKMINKFAADMVHSEVEDDCLTLTTYNKHVYPDSNIGWPENTGDSKIYVKAVVPYRSETMKAFKLQNGYELELNAADSIACGSIRLLGNSTYILPSLLQEISAKINDK